MEKYHIGQEILKEVKAKYPSVAAFARELCKSSSSGSRQADGRKQHLATLARR